LFSQPFPLKFRENPFPALAFSLSFLSPAFSSLLCVPFVRRPRRRHQRAAPLPPVSNGNGDLLPTLSRHSRTPYSPCCSVRPPLFCSIQPTPLPSTTATQSPATADHCRRRPSITPPVTTALFHLLSSAAHLALLPLATSAPLLSSRAAALTAGLCCFRLATISLHLSSPLA